MEPLRLQGVGSDQSLGRLQVRMSPLPLSLQEKVFMGWVGVNCCLMTYVLSRKWETRLFTRNEKPLTEFQI